MLVTLKLIGDKEEKETCKNEILSLSSSKSNIICKAIRLANDTSARRRATQISILALFLNENLLSSSNSSIICKAIRLANDCTIRRRETSDFRTCMFFTDFDVCSESSTQTE